MARLSTWRAARRATRTGLSPRVDRQGRETPIAVPPRAYYFPRVSPDGAHVAANAVVDQNSDNWVWNLARATLTRVTSNPAVDQAFVWSSDSQRLLFSSNRAGVFNLFSQAVDGTGAVERLTESPNAQIPTAVVPDGTRLVFLETTPTTGFDVMALQLDGTRQVVPLVQTPFDERNGIVSPDSRWLAYEASERHGSLRDLRSPISRRRSRTLASLDERRCLSAVGAHRAGAVLFHA